MKLLGYVHKTGERDGKPYNDYRLFVEESNETPGPEVGGTQILMNVTPYGSYFPKVSAEQFNKLLHQGMHIGSELRMYRDLKNHIIVELM